MELTVEEKKLVEKIITKHREITAGTGYGRVIIEYSKGKADIVGYESDRSTILLPVKKEKY